jgi:hypothetical protein
MRKWFLFSFLAGFCLFNTGCAVYMAAHQPEQKNLDLLKASTSRSSILAEFGTPVNTEQVDGEKTDVFKFKQGYSQGAKTARALGHGAADVLTLGLWEVVGTPTESVFKGKDMAVKITYDKDDRVKQVVYLSTK